jgi:hypothetical protein
MQREIGAMRILKAPKRWYGVKVESHSRDFAFDLEHAEWRIPAAKMKMRRLHRAPLSRQALAITRDLQAISPGGR